MKYNIIDSRSVVDPKNTTFYAIRTHTNNGHKYVEELYKRGVRDFVIEEDVPFLSDKNDANVLQVNSVVTELQNRAKEYRKTLSNTKFIAITGSRGKTIVKEWLYKLLSPLADRSPRSFNSQIGVPLSILSINPDAEVAIIETGISKPGEMETLRDIINPDIVVITNVTDEHSEEFENHFIHAQEKLKLALNAQTLVYHLNCDKDIQKIVDKDYDKSRQFSWSDSEDKANINLISKSIDKSRTILKVELNGKEQEIVLPFTDGYSIENAMIVLAAACVSGLNFDIRNFETFEAVNTRIDVIDGVNNCVLLYDTFTNDIKSLLPSIDFAARRITPDRTISLLLHIPDEKYKIELENNCEYQTWVQNLHIKVHYIEDVNEFLCKCVESNFKNEIILVKGSPSSGFNKIISLLEKKQHETVMEVNLDNIIHNYNFFRSKIKQETGIICMLKAEGYGAGSLQLAKTLQSQGAYAVAVAVIDEGVELRKAGITMPIIVLNPAADNLNLMFDYKLEPEVYSIDILKKIIYAAGLNDIHNFPIHIKLDTGMHRLGFEKYNLPELLDLLSKQNCLKVSSVFSHLATADCLNMNDYTQHQLSLFEQMSATIKESLNYSIKCHILNTAGILRYPEYQHELVRLGIGLYGIPVINDGSEKDLRPVSSLYSTIISISERNPGDTIGYSRKGVICRKSKIATVPIGYADGLDRHLGNGNTKFYINGVLCPTIGNICMDICMVDVTDCVCNIGDKVEIFGEHMPVTVLAEKLDTIPYEILTSISERVKRIYYRE
ncbi:MAG: bifunctional UDP-N-acetylmuramoyl-tripeptide:D-alanyl-D-alanine ligase/alanine racemase [Muribaculaceae bacterium]